MALEGTLHDMSLLDLFETFRMGNKSGVLRLFCLRQHSSIYVTMGRLIDAAVYDALTQQLVVRGDEAIVQLLQWDTAEFTFTHDPLTVRHPVTIFRDVAQLLRLDGEPVSSAAQVAYPPHMAMPISANLAFMHDLDPIGYAGDRHSGRNARHLGLSSTRPASNMPIQALTSSQMYGLNLLPHADQVQRDAAPEQARPILSERESCASEATQPIAPPRATASSPGRKLLAAVLRRVRAL